MLEILYRIYEVADEETAKKNLQNNLDFGLYNSTSKALNIELLMDCVVCDSREQFKDIIREQYGNDISFRYSKKLTAGELYCVIIGEHCYDTEKYFNKIKYICDCCGATVETYIKKPICYSDYEIKWTFFGIEEYSKKRFCSNYCKNKYTEKVKKFLKPNDEQEFYVSKDMFYSKNIVGYIYKISKKSTGEFYVGQTMYAPTWRWSQHLLTDRFPIDNIVDYKFEVLEVVSDTMNILEREKYYIQKLYKECPEKSLNISCTANLDTDNN